MTDFREVTRKKNSKNKSMMNDSAQGNKIKLRFFATTNS